MIRKHYKQVNEKDFQMVKALQEAGLSKLKIVDITGRSYSTITRLYASNSFKNYEENMHAYVAAHPKKTPYVKISEYGKAVGADKVEHTGANSSTIDVLISINKNLERMADAWEQHPDKGSLRETLFGSK